MKDLITYINENLKSKPKTKEELMSLIDELVDKTNSNQIDLNHIDVSYINDMSDLFSIRRNKKLLDINFLVENWNVSNVENMNRMFYGCERFNSDISNWDVSKVKSMNYMFYGCRNFEAILDKWDTHNVKDMYNMFKDTKIEKHTPSWYK